MDNTWISMMYLIYVQYKGINDVLNPINPIYIYIMRVAGLTSPPSADDYRRSCTQEYKELITVSPNSKRNSRMAIPRSAKECTKGSLFSVQMTANVGKWQHMLSHG